MKTLRKVEEEVWILDERPRKSCKLRRLPNQRAPSCERLDDSFNSEFSKTGAKEQVE